MLDLSVEANGSSAPNTTLLHWILPGLSRSSTKPITTTPLLSSKAAIAPYYPPGPPANQTHTYALYLYDEPATFSVPADYVPYFNNLTASVYNRVGFNLTDFAERSGLGEPVAANWYLISNTTTATASSSGAVTTASSTGTAASASSSAASAAGKGVEMGFFAMVFGVAGLWSSIW
jgi:Phosphatidylethanolamine-binding protein